MDTLTQGVRNDIPTIIELQKQNKQAWESVELREFEKTEGIAAYIETLKHLRARDHSKFTVKGVPVEEGVPVFKAEVRLQDIYSDPELQRWQDCERGLFLNPARYLKKKTDVLNGIYPIILECDTGSKAEQLQRLKATSLGPPSLIIDTTHRSYHFVYLIECQNVAKTAFLDLHKNLILDINGDESTLGLNREWRIPYTRHPKTGEEVKVVSRSGKVYNFNEISYFTPERSEADKLLFELNSAEKSYKYVNLTETVELALADGVISLVEDQGKNTKIYEIQNEDGLTARFYVDHKRNIFDVFSGQSLARKDIQNILDIKTEQQATSSRETVLRGPLVGADIQDQIELALDFEKVKKARLVAIRSAQGTGKTEAIEKYYEAFNLKHNVAYINPRVSLAESRIKEDGITALYNLPADDYKGSISLCIDSYSRNRKHFPNPVIVDIDEVSLVMDTLKGEANLTGYRLTQTKRDLDNDWASFSQVIIADADLQPEHVRYIQTKMGLDDDQVYIVDNLGTRTKEANIIQSPKDDRVIKALIEDVKADVKVIAGCDSMRRAEKVYNTLVKEAPEKKGVLVTSETREEDTIKAIFSNTSILQTMGLDYLVYSPAMSTGTSIKDFDKEDTQLFDKKYFFFSGNSSGVFECVQMTNRYRRTVPCTVWLCSNKKRQYPERPRAILDEGLKKGGLKVLNDDGYDYVPAIFGCIKSLETLGGSGFDDSDRIYISCQLASMERSNVARNEFNSYFIKKLELEGYQLTFLKEEDLDELEDSIKADMEARKLEVSLKECQDILDAIQISEIKAEELKRKAEKTKEERMQLKRHFLEKGWQKPLETIEEVSVAIERKNALFTAQEVLQPEYAKRKDSYLNNEAKHDLKFEVSTSTRSELFNELGLGDLLRQIQQDQSVHLDREDINLFHQMSLERKLRCESLIGINPAKYKNSGTYIKAVLKTLGLDIETIKVKENGKTKNNKLVKADPLFLEALGRRLETEVERNKEWQTKNRLSEFDLFPGIPKTFSPDKYTAIPVRVLDVVTDESKVNNSGSLSPKIRVQVEGTEDILEVAYDDIKPITFIPEMNPEAYKKWAESMMGGPAIETTETDEEFPF